MNNTKLQNEILNYFKSKVDESFFLDVCKDIENCNRSEYIELDTFIYFYNSMQKYPRLTATFNHNTQLERFDVLKEYYNDNKFYKFRVAMNRLMKDSYYMGHPKTIIKEF